MSTRPSNNQAICLMVLICKYNFIIHLIRSQSNVKNSDSRGADLAGAAGEDRPRLRLRTDRRQRHEYALQPLEAAIPPEEHGRPIGRRDGDPGDVCE